MKPAGTNPPPLVIEMGAVKKQPAVTLKKRKKKSSFFFIMGWVGLFAVLAGFAKPFFIPLAGGTFKAPASVHVHGAFAFAWIIFFLAQASLIRVKNYRRHIALGTVGLLVAAGTAITMLPAGVFVVQRQLNQGTGDIAYASIMGVVMSATMFLALVTAGMVFRSRRHIHKRLMLLATILVLWPAWFRFRHYFPSVPHPGIWFGVVLADSFIIVAWIRDWLREKKIHPVLLYGGSFIILENTFELLFFEHPFWRAAGKFIYEAVAFTLF